MDSSQRSKKISMSDLLSGVVDKMLRLQPVAIENHELSLTQKQANIRAVSLREGFQSILARGDEMTKRIGHYRQQHAALMAKRDGIIVEPPAAEAEETVVVVMSSS